MIKTLFCSLLLFGFTANAGILLEPYLGYSTGKFVKKDKAAGSTEYSDAYNNLAFGARVGYKFLIPWVALDYTRGSGTSDPDSKRGANGTKYDYTKTSIALVAGADIPLGLRVFGGYAFSNEDSEKGTTSTTTTKYTGSYTKVGVGYKIIPMVALNAEYVMNKYTKYENPTTNGKLDVDGSYSTFTHDVIMVSLSVPYSF